MHEFVLAVDLPAAAVVAAGLGLEPAAAAAPRRVALEELGAAHVPEIVRRQQSQRPTAQDHEVAMGEQAPPADEQHVIAMTWARRQQQLLGPGELRGQTAVVPPDVARREDEPVDVDVGGSGGDAATAFVAVAFPRVDEGLLEAARVVAVPARAGRVQGGRRQHQPVPNLVTG